MHVLITGGTGFIGRALSRQLFERGHTVTVLTRARSANAAPAAGVRLIQQLSDAQAVDAVVNLAGEPLAERRWNTERKALFRDSRIGTTEMLLSWMASL